MIDIQRLESILAEQFNDGIDVNGLTWTKGIYKAHISFDGKDMKGYRGTVTFTCNLESTGNIVDFELLDYTGMGYVNKPKVKGEE